MYNLQHKSQEITDFQSAPLVHLASAKRFLSASVYTKHKYMYVGNTRKIIQGIEIPA